ncbi:hypothetical protein [Pseudonocardia sp. TRM90224]|uniref:hypothetical protein n=1 Tax=Pseudonocardia sp. TRM90224 TaxID=2812678 RepID=UPI001E6186CD|nr:hypothetical protein [Pseudonocardia sp. TRM90224]
MFGSTEAPPALGARSALSWIGGLSPTTPLVGLPHGPSQSRAIAEFMVANKVAAGEEYPPAPWWAKYDGFNLDRAHSREWWAVNAYWGYTRENAQDVQLAIGWAFGVIDNVAVLTPARAGDGSEIGVERREHFARMLHRLAPLPPGLQPQAEAGRVAPGAGQTSA